MAFPQVQSITETQFSSGATSHAVAMPATVNAGDLLIILFEASPNPTLTTPSGWTLLFDSGRPFGVYVKVAAGTEGGTTVDVVTSTTRQGAAQVYRITQWYGALAGVEAGTAVNEGGGAPTTTPDPPSLTPSWGALDTLWIACFGAVDDDATVSAYPTNYTNGTDTVSGAGANLGATVGSARRELNAVSDDPGTFTLSEAELWVAQTIAIRPGVDATVTSVTATAAAAAGVPTFVLGADVVSATATASAAALAPAAILLDMNLASATATATATALPPVVYSDGDIIIDSVPAEAGAAALAPAFYLPVKRPPAGSARWTRNPPAGSARSLRPGE